jgi:hypothetical protein
MRKVWPAAAEATAQRNRSPRAHNTQKKKLTAAKDKTTSAVKVPNGREYLGPHVNKETICNLFIFFFRSAEGARVNRPPGHIQTRPFLWFFGCRMAAKNQRAPRRGRIYLLFSRTLEEMERPSLAESNPIKSMGSLVFRLKVGWVPAPPSG